MSVPKNDTEQVNDEDEMVSFLRKAHAGEAKPKLKHKDEAYASKRELLELRKMLVAREKAAKKKKKQPTKTATEEDIVHCLHAHNEELIRRIMDERQPMKEARLPRNGMWGRREWLDVRLKHFRTKGGAHIDTIQDIRWFQYGGGLQGIFSVCKGGRMFSWNPTTNEGLDYQAPPKHTLLTGDVTPNCQLSVSGGLNGECYLYNHMGDVERCALICTLTTKGMQRHAGYHHGCYSVFSTRFLTNQQLLIGDLQHLVTQFDVDALTVVNQFRGHAGGVYTVACPKLCSGNSCVFASGSFDGTVKVWDSRVNAYPIRSYAIKHKTDTQDKSVDVVEFFPTGNCLAAGCGTGDIYMFDLRADQVLMKFPGNRRSRVPTPVSCLQFSVSGRALFTSYKETKDIAVFDVLTGCHNTNIDLPQSVDVVNRIAISPLGGALAIGRDKTMVDVYSSV